MRAVVRPNILWNFVQFFVIHLSFVLSKRKRLACQHGCEGASGQEFILVEPTLYLQNVHSSCHCSVFTPGGYNNMAAKLVSFAPILEPDKRGDRGSGERVRLAKPGHCLQEKSKIGIVGQRCQASWTALPAWENNEGLRLRSAAIIGL